MMITLCIIGYLVIGLLCVWFDPSKTDDPSWPFAVVFLWPIFAALLILLTPLWVASLKDDRRKMRKDRDAK